MTFRSVLSGISKVTFVLTLLVPMFSAAVIGQKRAGDEEMPVFREYRGVQIGMTTDEARKKLGSPKDKADDQDFYIFGDRETAQIMYDKAHKVSVLSVDYMSGAEGIPTAKTVMGSDIQTKADGSMYKMIRYIKAGFWVSYSRTGGDSPMVSITIQKIE